jgi:subtilisin family serine protease
MKFRLILGASFVLSFVALCAYATQVPAARRPLARATGFATTASSKITPSVEVLRQKLGNQVPVLVILREQADLSGSARLRSKEAKGRYVYQALTRTALRSQVGLIQALDQRGVSYHRFYITNAIAIEHASPELIRELAARPDVAKIIGDPAVPQLLPRGGKSVQAAPQISENIVATGAPRVWQELHARGQGIVVAGQDTGVEWQHPALKPHYRGVKADGTVSHDFNWHDSIHHAIVGTPNPCGYDSPAPCDDDEHGTHTMGTMVGDDGQGTVTGMAPEAKWIACHNMDQGTGTPASYIECFEYFLAPYAQGADPLHAGRPDLAPDVINNSWGCPPDEGCDGSEFGPALHALNAAGIVVVASAGNDGPDCSTIDNPPAFYTDDTLSVGAIDHRTGEIAEFSSRGPSKLDGGIGPDVTAPGVNVLSTVPGGQYAKASGTSMAGPHVAGLVALLWSARPDLIGQVATTVQLIRAAADPKTTTESCGGINGSAIPNNTYGYGAINAQKVVGTFW